MLELDDQTKIETFIEYEGYWSEEVNFNEIYKSICSTHLNKIVSDGSRFWPNVDNIIEITAVIDANKTDFFVALSCLKKLRILFTKTNQEEFTIKALLKYTGLIRSLDLLQAVKFDDKVTIELETLWVLENMTYCCESKDDMWQLVMKIAGPENIHLRNMLFRSFRVDVESERPLSEAHRDL